jgi:hypothetical protein
MKKNRKDNIKRTVKNKREEGQVKGKIEDGGKSGEQRREENSKKKRIAKR